MDKKKLVLLVGALVVALGTAFLARSMFAGASAPQTVAAEAPAVTGPKVLVANRALPVGTIITPDAFSFQPWPEELVEKAYFLEDNTDGNALLGTVVRNEITAGQPVTQGSLVKPGDRGFLAAALGPGMRAVTVPVSERTSVGGFVFPGDRIDLVLTQAVKGKDGPDLKASETIIRNLRVLATGQRVSSQDEEGNQVVIKFNTVTVEVTPKLAEKIAVAQTIGVISLSLRSIADNEAELERAIAAGEINVPESDDPEAEEKFIQSIVKRPMDTDPTFVTGGDVSRFQRTSVPSQKSAAPAQIPAVPAPKPQPKVRVARGKNVTAVPVGGK
ncbi:Flp pilus assembly protein CpaB [Alterisphingorhabdus coralli]|uniref:Flp pilus assembly protein CpaB n=1 Tax=Alterisphingorhabdus coralli TaxID=3071408 RepID=A0AA97I1D3_9SPHN|nr:Flp pilus assembly protein CpaB [Parasphingorhabdus sp. SCSIO 66989]WOE74615.1 Flp pilus assembly protein CpaB [Parasphingorhabdus sp. SCSIO 66989]